MSAASPASRPVVQTIGRYQLKAKAGEGASGVVFRAYDPLLDRDCAIKLARTNTLSEDELKHIKEEFHHEAQIAGKFAHENVVTIYDVVSDGLLSYIVMEFVAGRSVQDYMDVTGPLGIDETLAVMYKCAIGLAYIHFEGVIHRDIKPGNIMYHPAQGVTKLMDFSVAHKIEQPPARDTGTIAYMAPEHFDRKRKISMLTDVFAMGSTMYRLLTGKYPFDPQHTAFQILHQDPEPITDLRPDVPPKVAEIVYRAMSKADGDRYQSAADFARSIEQVAVWLYPNSDVVDDEPPYMRA
jgi:eukaryotic-like serine/threonine-protein kinase